MSISTLLKTVSICLSFLSLSCSRGADTPKSNTEVATQSDVKPLELALPVEGEEEVIAEEEQKFCISPEEFANACKSAKYILDNACPALLPQLGCFLGGFPDFCKNACAGKRFGCEFACGQFLKESPGPYGVVANQFIQGACSSKDLVKFCNMRYKELVKEVKSLE